LLAGGVDRNGRQDHDAEVSEDSFHHVLTNFWKTQ
jgi:hypothetical protein